MDETARWIAGSQPRHLMIAGRGNIGGGRGESGETEFT